MVIKFSFGHVFVISLCFQRSLGYARKYPEIMKVFTSPDSGGLFRAFQKVKFYCVKPDRILYIDNEQGFGKRQELIVER